MELGGTKVVASLFGPRALGHGHEYSDEGVLSCDFKFAPFAPICFISASQKSGLTAMMQTVQSVSAEWHKGVPRYDLRRTVLNAVAAHPPALSGRSAAKIYSVAQDATGPPSFTFYVNRAEMVHFGYQRYLENALRDAYGFSGSPLKMRFKRRGEK